MKGTKKKLQKPVLRPYYAKGIGLECGCDEAGRGCLAGAVYAAAVILPRDFTHPLLNDSKQLTEAQRLRLRPIIEREALAWAIGVCGAEEIDQLNILKASHRAMHRAIAELTLTPDLLLIDGNLFSPYPQLPHHCIVHGDATYRSIAAASVLAKTHRDTYMQEQDALYHGYGFAQHKGYPTTAHRKAIERLGLSPIHRQTFHHPLPDLFDVL